MVLKKKQTGRSLADTCARIMLVVVFCGHVTIGIPGKGIQGEAMPARGRDRNSVARNIDFREWGNIATHVGGGERVAAGDGSLEKTVNSVEVFFDASFLGNRLAARSEGAQHRVSVALTGPVPWGTFFHTEGRDIVADLTGDKVILRGVNLNGLEFGTFFDRPYTGIEGTDFFRPRPEDFAQVKAFGSNVIRVPFEWARLVRGWRPFDPLPIELDEVYLGLLDDAVGMAASEQLYVILDMHDFLKYWSGESAQVCVECSPGHQELLRQTWKLLAEHYRDNTAVIGYDIQNEPVRQTDGQNPPDGQPEVCSSCEWHLIAQSVVNAIREVDSNHLIFVEGPNFSLASDWPNENRAPFVRDLVTPSRIVYSPHVYFDFDNNSIYNDTNEASEPKGQWEFYVRDRLMEVINWSENNDVPILFGETNVPCSTAWAAVLEHVFVNFLDPLALSFLEWHYIDPIHCQLSDCPLNLAACPGSLQLEVLRRHPGGVYQERSGFALTPSDSRIYDDDLTNPWDPDDGSFGMVTITLCATDHFIEGSCSLFVHFSERFAGVKFIHRHGIDTRQFSTLKFRIRLGSADQNFKIFTTSPPGDCVKGMAPVFPAFDNRPELRQFLPPSPEEWPEVEIPLWKIVDPRNPIINGIAFQNLEPVDVSFHLDDIRLIPATTCPTVSNIIPANGAAGRSVSITGSNLGAVSSVRFANNKHAAFQRVSDTELRVEIPEGSETGPITISQPNCPDLETAPITVFATDRVVQAPDVRAVADGTATIPIEINALGNENSIRLSLNYDATLLSNPQVVLGDGAVGATLNIDQTNGDAGRLGISISLPPGQILAAGNHKLALASFDIKPGVLGSTAALSFGDLPTAREVLDAQGSELTSAYRFGSLTVTRGFESDVSPRPNGSNTGTVTVSDWVQVGRFAVGLDTMNGESELRRADCAPRETSGDGMITLSDWVQAGRYAAGLDSVICSGGPTTPVASLSGSGPPLVEKPSAEAMLKVKSVHNKLERTRSRLMTVSLLARGDENAVSFSLQYYPRLLRFVGARPAGDIPDATLLVNSNDAAIGRIGVAVALPPGQRLSPGDRAIVEAHFELLARKKGEKQPLVTLGNSPLRIEIVDANGHVLHR